jgi:cytochrome c2
VHTDSQTPAPNHGAGFIAGLRSRAGRIAARHILLAAAALAIVGAALGYAAAKMGVLHDLRVGIIDPAIAGARRAMGAPEESAWEVYGTHLGRFEKVRVSVADRGGGPMAALEELDGHLVFMAQSGHFSTLAPDRTLRDLDIDAPMHTDDVRAANIPSMDFTHFRALDLLAVPTAPHSFDLYASFDRYRADERCFDIVVARMRIVTTQAELTPRSGWEEVYATTPCVPPRTAISQFPSAFVGIQSGGRLVLRDAHTLLLSVGDLEFDGVMYEGLTEAPNGPQNPAWDLGKVLEIDLGSGRARHFAMGFRNPQGLLVDAAGRVWSTEHGPYGGDEINLLRSGGNYGWPNVTYGMRYVPRGENWPLNPTHGGHEGYDRPAYVFVPSIGISQLIQPSANVFPFWDHALLITSLRGRSLFVARLDGDRIAYVEPLPMGERLRDIINRGDGEIAILTDVGNLVLLRPQTAPERESTFSIVDARGRAGPESSEEAGRRVFAANCQSCHTLDGRSAMGPPLNGVVGRDIAATDFAYSPALQNATGVWTRSRLLRLLTDEAPLYPGSAMPPPRLARDDARDVIAYLRATP